MNKQFNEMNRKDKRKQKRKTKEDKLSPKGSDEEDAGTLPEDAEDTGAEVVEQLDYDSDGSIGAADLREAFVIMNDSYEISNVKDSKLDFGKKQKKQKHKAERQGFPLHPAGITEGRAAILRKGCKGCHDRVKSDIEESIESQRALPIEEMPLDENRKRALEILSGHSSLASSQVSSMQNIPQSYITDTQLKRQNEVLQETHRLKLPAINCGYVKNKNLAEKQENVKKRRDSKLYKSNESIASDIAVLQDKYLRVDEADDNAKIDIEATFISESRNSPPPVKLDCTKYNSIGNPGIKKHRPPVSYWSVPPIQKLHNLPKSKAIKNTIDAASIYSKEYAKTMEMHGQNSLLLDPLKTSTAYKNQRPDGQLVHEKNLIVKDKAKYSPLKRFARDQVYLPAVYTDFFKDRERQKLYVKEIYKQEQKKKNTNKLHCVRISKKIDNIEPCHYCDVLGRKYCSVCIEHKNRHFARGYEKHFLPDLKATSVHLIAPRLAPVLLAGKPERTLTFSQFPPKYQYMKQYISK